MFQTSWRYPHYFAKIYAINLPSVVMPIIAYDGGRAPPVDQEGHVVFCSGLLTCSQQHQHRPFMWKQKSQHMSKLPKATQCV